MQSTAAAGNQSQLNEAFSSVGDKKSSLSGRPVWDAEKELPPKNVLSFELSNN